MQKIIHLIVLVVFMFLMCNATAYAVIIFQEDFTGTELPSSWHFDTDGQWSIENNALNQSKTSTGAHADSWAGDESWTNYVMQMRFQYQEFGTNNMEAGVTLRGVSVEGGMTVRTSWRGSSWNLELMRSGMTEWHMPLNQNLITGQWYTMKADIEDKFLKVWVNDILYDFGDIYPPSPTFPSHGKIGLWANNAHVHFDDVLVDNLQPVSESSPVPEPSSLLLLGTGFLGLLKLRRRK